MNNPTETYPAHDSLKDRLSVIKHVGGSNMTITNRITADELLNEFNALKSRYEALLNAVCILPDGAKAIDGDVVMADDQYWDNKRNPDREPINRIVPMQVWDTGKWLFMGYPGAKHDNTMNGSDWVIPHKVVMRQGRPVIYQSQLKVGV